MLKRPPFPLGLVATALTLAACTSVQNQPDSAGLAARSFIYAPSSTADPSLRTASEDGAADVARIAGRIAEEPHPTSGGRLRRVEGAAVPLIHDSPEGRALSLFPGPVALAEGDPADHCPARAAAAGPDLVTAAEGALHFCLLELSALDPPAAPDCGCRLLAAGDRLFAPPSAFRYAPGVSARLVSRQAGIDLAMVAVESPDGPDDRRLLLRPTPGGALAEARIADDGVATLTLDGETWTGRAFAEGFDRGRRRERLYLTRDDGARMALIVGWEPVAYAMERKRLLAWPAT